MCVFYFVWRQNMWQYCHDSQKLMFYRYINLYKVWCLPYGYMHWMFTRYVEQVPRKQNGRRVCVFRRNGRKKTSVKKTNFSKCQKRVNWCSQTVTVWRDSTFLAFIFQVISNASATWCLWAVLFSDVMPGIVPVFSQSGSDQLGFCCGTSTPPTVILLASKRRRYSSPKQQRTGKVQARSHYPIPPRDLSLYRSL